MKKPIKYIQPLRMVDRKWTRSNKPNTETFARYFEKVFTMDVSKNDQNSRIIFNQDPFFILLVNR